MDMEKMANGGVGDAEPEFSYESSSIAMRKINGQAVKTLLSSGGCNEAHKSSCSCSACRHRANFLMPAAGVARYGDLGPGNIEDNDMSPSSATQSYIGQLQWDVVAVQPNGMTPAHFAHAVSYTAQKSNQQ